MTDRTIEQRVAQHYTHGTLEESILAALRAAGKDLDHLSPDDLAPVDEFHIGGREATADFAAQLDFKPGMLLLDVGCGVGGPSRYFAKEWGCRVNGIDLTEEYVRVAEALARRTGLSGTVTYRCASASDLPFPAGTFDGAYMLHVGMNIENKIAVFQEVRRVLKPGAVFGVYDIMRESEGELNFPMPWSSSPETSFVESPATYRRLLQAAGFDIQKERNRRDFAIEFFRAMRAQAAASGGPPPLGLHIPMGAAWPQKIENAISSLDRGLIAPVEMVVCRVQ
jgi:ubiquinone/menaquinone biosynthesis C-methylase UbiE